jgi:hypothetical protein
MPNRGHEVRLSEDVLVASADTNGLSSDSAAIDPKDMQALTVAISQIADSIVRKTVENSLSNLLPPLLEQSLRTMLPEYLPALLGAAVADQKSLLKETAEEVTRQALPGLMGPIIERLAKDMIQEQAQKMLETTGLAVIEKIAWEIVPSQAEIEVKKEIERLTADA